MTCFVRLHELLVNSGNTSTSTVTLISASDTIKRVSAVEAQTRYSRRVTIEEQSVDAFAHEFVSSNAVNLILRVIRGTVTRVDASKRLLTYDTAAEERDLSSTITYDRLCVASGAVPTFPFGESDILTFLRDSATIVRLKERIRRIVETKRQPRIILVGNGGIAMELVWSLQSAQSALISSDHLPDVTHLQLVWAVRDGYIGHTFLDRSSSAFLIPKLFSDDKGMIATAPHHLALSQASSDVTVATRSTATYAGAVGPDWVHQLHTQTQSKSVSSSQCQVTVALALDCSIASIQSSSADSAHVQLSNGDIYECDLIIAATGVRPNTSMLSSDEFVLGADGGVRIDETMRTNIANVVACGDCTHCEFMSDDSRDWHQMRLWETARHTALNAADAMFNMDESPPRTYFYPLFAHTTKLVGCNVVLLGRYNAQNTDTTLESAGTLDADYSVLMRVRPLIATEEVDEFGQRVYAGEYIRCILHKGQLIGCTLMNESTELAETMENLIVNRMDLSSFGDFLSLELPIDVVLEDYFD